MRERIDSIYLLLQEAYIEIAKEHPTSRYFLLINNIYKEVVTQHDHINTYK